MTFASVFEPHVPDLKPSGGTDSAEHIGLCPFHEDSRPSFSANAETGLWRCYGCGAKGDAIGFLRQLRGLGFKEAKAEVERLTGQATDHIKPAPGKAAAGRIVATYDYHDERGQLLFQVCRFDPKDFRQRRPDGKGGWSWSLKDARRALYRLPELLAADPTTPVLVAEGEKDADNLHKLGLTATTCPMGAGKWRPEYSQSLRGKHVVILPDADEPGREHARQVAASLHGLAASVKLIDVPSGAWEGKDVSDFLAANSPEEFAELLASARPYQPQPEGGPPVDIDSHRINSLLPLARAEMARNAARSPDVPLGFTTGFPWLDRPTEGLLPSTFWVLGAFTSTGKTALALQMALAALEAGAVVAFFSLEMSSRANIFRLLACRSGVPAVAIRRGHLEARDKAAVEAAWLWLDRQPAQLFDQLYSLEAISAAARALKHTEGLDVLFLDYLQNLGGDGSLFERMSRAAPQLQALAKELDCCIVGLSQISNEAAKGGGFQTFKGAGEIEASADVALWLERDSENKKLVYCYVKKNKEGPAGLKKTLQWMNSFTRLATATL
jgi:5S rRNA maturation endonuclease (ribonuclease M5)